MTAQLIQLGASLVAIFALAGFARWLGLGGDVRIDGTDHAKRIAIHSMSRFAPTDAVVDRAGYSALVKDEQGRHVLIAKTGAHFVARLLHAPIDGKLDQTLLTIDPREPGTAPVTLNLGKAAQYWASGLRHIPRG